MRGTYQQRVYEQGGRHAGTLHYRDGQLYEKSWIDNGQWIHGDELDRRYGKNHQYEGLQGHTYGRMERTSAPEVEKGPDIAALLAEQMKGFTSSIQDITRGMKENMMAMQKTMADQQAGYQKQLTEMTNTMTAANKAKESQEKVLGVKSAGGPDAMSIKKGKQGVKGTFGREGLRIKSLNVK